MLTSEELRDSFKYLYRDELPFLKKLVRELPFKNPVVINIGAGAGTSGLAIIESRSDVTLCTVDIQDESSPFGCLEAERDVMQRAGYGSLINDSWFQFHMSSTKFAQNNPHLEVMMVFIDGDHSYYGCTKDIENWKDRIEKGGIIAVHDYQKELIVSDGSGPHPMPWPGVSQAVNELLLNQYEFVGQVDSLIAFKV